MLRCRGRAQVVSDPGTGARQLLQVVAGVRRQAGLRAGLEVLLGTAGDTGVLQQLAEERRAAALGGADEV